MFRTRRLAPSALASACVLAMAGAATTAHAETLTLNIAGTESRATLYSGDNTVFEYVIGAGRQVTNISFTVSLLANAPSWLSEIGLAVSDSAAATSVSIHPGFGVNTAGTAAYSGSYALLAPELNVITGADGVLRLEFFDSTADGLSPDGRWLAGSLALEHIQAVPEPATYALWLTGIAGIAALRARRTKPHH